MKKILFACLLFTGAGFGQNATGFWDKDRSFTKEIKLKAGDRQVVSVTDFPTGTTEFVYRITVLDENQQLSNNLFSLLKSIPDPSGISQGAAGGVFLLSKVSGSDKCRYALFGDAADADKFQKTGTLKNACYSVTDALSKDAGRLFGKNFSCTAKKLYIGVESDNWLFSQKIVLEVVPWVDARKSSGWTAARKKEIIALAKEGGVATKMLQPNEFCSCILEKISAQYTYEQYTELLAEEKMRLYSKSGSLCLSQKESNAGILAAIRKDVQQYIEKEQFEKAVSLLETTIFEYKLQKTEDVNSMARAFIFSKQFDNALQIFAANPSLSNVETKILHGHALLLTGEKQDAADKYKSVITQQVTSKISARKLIESDFAQFSKWKEMDTNFERILNKLD